VLYFLCRYLERLGLPRVFRYITTRGALSFIFSLGISLGLGRPLINTLYRHGYRSNERSYQLSASGKQGTPMMGGLLIMIACVGVTLLWCDLSNPYVLPIIAVGLVLAALGAADDIQKVKGKKADKEPSPPRGTLWCLLSQLQGSSNDKSDKGLSRLVKYTVQGLLGLALGILVWHPSLSPLPEEVRTKIYVPFYKYDVVDIGWLYVPAIAVWIVGASNAVNLTDGMDGLAIVPTITVSVVMAVFAYITGNQVWSKHLLYTFLPRVAEITVLCLSLVGAGMGFLWFNTFPAEVFMGDTGSMFLGGILGTAALFLKQEMIFLFAGSLFIVEGVSSLVQEKFGLRKGKRIFYRAPLHDTYKHQGMAESKVTVRYWIISILVAAIALATIKVR